MKNLKGAILMAIAFTVMSLSASAQSTLSLRNDTDCDIDVKVVYSLTGSVCTGTGYAIYLTPLAGNSSQNVNIPAGYSVKLVQVDAGASGNTTISWNCSPPTTTVGDFTCTTDDVTAEFQSASSVRFYI